MLISDPKRNNPSTRHAPCSISTRVIGGQFPTFRIECCLISPGTVFILKPDPVPFNIFPNSLWYFNSNLFCFVESQYGKLRIRIVGHSHLFGRRKELTVGPPSVKDCVRMDLISKETLNILLYTHTIFLWICQTKDHCLKRNRVSFIPLHLRGKLFDIVKSSAYRRLIWCHPRRKECQET